VKQENEKEPEPWPKPVSGDVIKVTIADPFRGGGEAGTADDEDQSDEESSDPSDSEDDVLPAQMNLLTPP